MDAPDDGSELFGDHTPLPDGSIAAHGFEALAGFDTDLSGSVSDADAAWTALRLWRDQDRVSVNPRAAPWSEAARGRNC